MKTLVHNDQEIIDDIIERSEICFIGVVTPDNTPYVLPMNFSYRGGKLYLHSAPEGKVIDCLENNSSICVSFSIDHQLAYQNKEVACSYTMKSKSVVVNGKVSFVEDMEEKRKALDLFMSHYSDQQFKFNDPAVRNVKIWVVDIDQISCREFGVHPKP
ncbi:pyridoxamine 5'-phosphate oxidase family protein [Marinilabiliaceae bacterium ANBcel2]|nr:pyridoxamine 5'-phosphate oxidase family protein [Marinilabiliaceae bacterium ANBcel2]